MIQAISPGSTAVTFRSGAGAQDANVFIPLDVAYRHSTQAHQLAPRLKQSLISGNMTGGSENPQRFRMYTERDGEQRRTDDIADHPVPPDPLGRLDVFDRS